MTPHPVQTSFVAIDMHRGHPDLDVATMPAQPDDAFPTFIFDSCGAVLSDCIASMYGGDLHVPGLQNFARCPGWVKTNDQFFEKPGSAGVTPRAAQIS
jgi:hypothetical protein